MANWCDNRLTVTGPKADLARFKEQAKGAYPWAWNTEQKEEVLNCHSLLPIPADVLQDGSEEAYRESGERWEIQNWGCPYGATRTRLDGARPGCLWYGFESKWVPPVYFFRKIGPNWPTLTFYLRYDELTGDSYAGCFLIRDRMYREKDGHFDRHQTFFPCFTAKQVREFSRDTFNCDPPVWRMNLFWAYFRLAWRIRRSIAYLKRSCGCQTAQRQPKIALR